MYRGEFDRTLEKVELREDLRINYDITDTQYSSSHEIDGQVRAIVKPDREVLRTRKNPPNGFLSSIAGNGNEDALGKNGYPGTELFFAVTRVPPLRSDDDLPADTKKQDFNVSNIPENGTVKLSAEWDEDDASRKMSNDESKVVEHNYEITQLPSDQLPIVIRAELVRDARAYLENTITGEAGTIDLKEYEGFAVLSVQVEYREGNEENTIAGGGGRLFVQNFRFDMASTFPNISFRPSDNSTYNPEQNRVEWRKREISPGETIQYDIFGKMEELLGLGSLEASIQGIISGETLSGTKLEGIYDRTGKDIIPNDSSKFDIGHGIRLNGDISIDPNALRSRSRKVMDATVNLNDTPFDAFDRLQRVCDSRGMTITESVEPSNPEPVSNKDGVLAIGKGEKGEGDDEPGKLEVKREYGDRGVVYADMIVYGKFTSMTQGQEVSRSAENQSEDKLVRADEGGLEDRGKSTVEINARSADSELNTRLIRTIQDGLGGGA